MKRGGGHQEEKGEASASKLQGMTMFEGQRLWRRTSARLSSEGRTEASRSSGFFSFPLQVVLATSSPKH